MGMGVVVVEVVVTVAGQVQLSMSPCGCVILYPSGHVTLRRRHSYLAPSTGPGTLAPSRLNKIGSTPSAVVSALVFKPGQPTGLHWGAFGNEHVLSRTSTDQDTQQPRTRTSRCAGQIKTRRERETDRHSVTGTKTTDTRISPQNKERERRQLWHPWLASMPYPKARVYPRACSGHFREATQPALASKTDGGTVSA